jgi:hypothetical protein
MLEKHRDEILNMMKDIEEIGKYERIENITRLY